MKRILLTILGAIAIAGSAKADPQVVINSTHAEEDARNAAIARAQMDTEKQAVLRGVLRGELSSDQVIDDVTNLPGLLHGLKNQELRSKMWHAEHPLVEGDRLPLPNAYDDEATIRLYLRDSGYNDLSNAQIAKISAYMKTNHIHHVSELGPITSIMAF